MVSVLLTKRHSATPWSELLADLPPPCFSTLVLQVAILEIGALGTSRRAPRLVSSHRTKSQHFHSCTFLNSSFFTHTVTSLLAGQVGDIFGRRKTLFAGALIFSIGGVFQTFTTGFRLMVFGRILSGFGVGFLS